MRKRSAQDYVKVLYEVTKGISKSELDEILKRFVSVLHNNNDIGLLAEIMRQFGEYYNSQNGVTEVDVTTVYELDKKEQEEIQKKVEDVMDAKVDAVYKVDKEILGGIIARTKDLLFDASVSKQLEKLKSSIN